MTGRMPIGPDELGTDRPDELDDARTAAAWLGAAIEPASIRPSADFTDRVMAALADEPTPSRAGFLTPLRRLGLLGGFGASVRGAWVAAFGGGRPLVTRASALAYVLVVAIAGTSLAGVATVGVAGALGVLGPTPTQSAAPESPGPSRAPEPSLALLNSLPVPTDDASGEPSYAPGASDDHGSGGAEPTHLDDGNPGPGSSGPGGDDGGSSSGSSSSGPGSGTPRPSDTPRPTGTPKPSETPH